MGRIAELYGSASSPSPLLLTSPALHLLFFNAAHTLTLWGGGSWGATSQGRLRSTHPLQPSGSAPRQLTRPPNFNAPHCTQGYTCTRCRDNVSSSGSGKHSNRVVCFVFTSIDMAWLVGPGPLWLWAVGTGQGPGCCGWGSPGAWGWWPGVGLLRAWRVPADTVTPAWARGLDWPA